VKRTVVELVSLLSLGIFPATLHGVEPDLASAPPPKLSQTAWHELLQSAGAQQSVTLHAQITASHGAVRQVDIQEVKEWPRTSTEVQTWIRQKWNFVSGFTGTVVQPISLKIVRAQATPTPIEIRPKPWPDTGRLLLIKSPKPLFPYWLLHELGWQNVGNAQAMGVLLSIGVHHGAIVDLRVIDHTGPLKLSEYTAEWVREHWLFQPTTEGTYTLPVYYLF
jgi:hypothetical protein